VIRFIVKKLIYGIVVLFGAVTVVFFLFNLVPGDPVRMMGGQNMTEDVVKTFRHDLGLDLPIHKRYLLYLNDVSPISLHNTVDPESHAYLDREKYEGYAFGITRSTSIMLKVPYLRRSFQTRRKVSEIITQSIPGTFILAITAIIIATVLGIILGIFAAVKKGTFIDSSSLVIAVLGMSAPSFYSAMIIAWLFGYVWHDTTTLPALPFLFLVGGLIYGIVMNRKKNDSLFNNFSWSYLLETVMKSFGLGIGIWLAGIVLNSFMGGSFIPMIDWNIAFPGTGLNMTGTLIETDDFGNEYTEWKNLILPAITLGIRPLAIIVQLTRSSLLEVMSQDYIRTASAKGLSYYSVIVKHALKNALNPVVTAISGWFASLLAGAVFIEYVFGWQGLGLKLYNSLIKMDLPVVMGSVLVIATIFVVINLIVDIVYGILDPRVRVS
jgi:peptide/nickel transport system permease protein